MAAISEDFVSFEIAKLLKEKGFQQLQDNCGYFTTEMVYSINVDKNGEHHFAHQYPAGVYNKDKYIAAPTLQMAMKWLREVHNWTICISPYWPEGDMRNKLTWYYDIHSLIDNISFRESSYTDNYTKACEAAIKYCLENLI